MVHPRNFSRKASSDDVALTFPQKLMELLEDRSHEDVVAWLDNGKAFRVFDKHVFTQHVLPRFFRHRPSKFLSFVRKLNRWGFTRVQSHAAVDRNYAEQPVYTHPLFQRGQHNLLSQLNCTVLGAAATGQQVAAAKLMSGSSSATKRPSSSTKTPSPAPRSLRGQADDKKEKDENNKSRTRSAFERPRLLSCPAPVRSCKEEKEEENKEEPFPPQLSALLEQSANRLLSHPASSGARKRPIDKGKGGSMMRNSRSIRNQQLLPVLKQQEQGAHSSEQEQGEPYWTEQQAQKQAEEFSLSVCSSSLGAVGAAASREPSLLALLFGQVCAHQEALQQAENELLVRHFTARALLEADTAAIAQSLASYTAQTRKQAESSLLVRGGGGGGGGGAPTRSILASLPSVVLAPTTISSLFSDNKDRFCSLLASTTSTTPSSALCSSSTEQSSTSFATAIPPIVAANQQHCGEHNNNNNILHLLSLLHYQQNQRQC